MTVQQLFSLHHGNHSAFLKHHVIPYLTKISGFKFIPYKGKSHRYTTECGLLHIVVANDEDYVDYSEESTPAIELFFEDGK